MTLRVCSLIVALVAACGNRDRDKAEGSAVVVQSRALEDVVITLPEGWTSSYDKDADAWQVVAPGGITARIERADERYVASPDAYMNHIAPRWGKNKLVTIEHREPVSAGFAMTLAVFENQNDPRPLHATYVVKQVRRVWYQCFAEGVDDDVLRRQIVSMCRSVRP